MDDKTRPRSAAERIRTLAQAALTADETVDQMDHILDDLEVNLVGLNKAVGTMEDSLEYFNTTLHRLNESLGQLEGMMGRVMRLVDLAESAMAPVAATESAVRGVLNVIRRK
jgi:membrane protein required for beta-lactamase induction